MNSTSGGSGLQIASLSKRFDTVQALDGVDLNVARGQMVGFLGPNGAGKTTAMRAVLGLITYDAGTISWNGRPMTSEDRRHIGYMPQERGLYPRMKVHEHIAYIGRIAGVDADEASRRADEWVERVNLEERRDDIIQELSVGNQQRVQLAVALVHNPDLLVLDEPFAGLDPVAVNMMSEVMVERVESGVSVVFSSHQMELVQDLCENVTIIASGQSRASGTVNELRSASGRRELEVTWTDGPNAWVPEGAESLPADPGVSRFRLPSGADPIALANEASTAGQIQAIRFEPPGLEEVFIELVAT